MNEMSVPVSSPGWDQIHCRLEELKQLQVSRQTDPAFLEEKLARRAQFFRDRVQQIQSSPPALPAILFTAQGGRYALPLRSVVEVQPLEAFSIVPQGPDFIHGLVHYRGSILALFNLTRLLGSSRPGISDLHYYLVAQGAGHQIAVAAGVVEDLFLIPLEDIKTPPEWGEAIPHRWIRGVYQEDCLVLELDAILSDDRMARWSQRPGSE